MELELQFLDLIQSFHTPLMDTFMIGISAAGNGGAVWLLLAVVLIAVPKTRRSGFILTAALCADVVLCNVILKNLVGRIRPCDVNTAVKLLIERPSDFSFPSGHTAAAFASAAALGFAGEKRLWPPVLLLASLMAFSRLYLYVHYPTDILGGILVGIASGYLGYRGIERLKKTVDKKADEM